MTIITINTAFLKTLMIAMFVFISFFLNVNSIWFTLIVSTIIGSIYYLLIQTYPQTIMFLCMVVKYKKNKFKQSIQKWFYSTKKNFTYFFNKSNNKLKLQCDDNYNFLEYYDIYKEKKHIFLFNKKFRSNDLIIFKDEFDNDITDYIEPYLGPLQNFHGVYLTPADFNHKRIKVFRDGDISLSKTFEEHEPLKFV